MSEDTNLEIIAECLRRIRNGLSYFAAGCLAITIVFAAVGFNQKKPTSFVLGVGFASATGTVITGCLALKNAKITASEIYTILKNYPEKIVWVYPVGIKYKVNGIQTSTENAVYINLENERCLKLRSIPSQDLESVLSAIKQQAPHAVYGFSEAVRLKYLENPKSF